MRSKTHALLLSAAAMAAASLLAATPVAHAQGAASSAARQSDFIVAVVNSEPITNQEVQRRIVRVTQQIQQQGGRVPPQAELARQVLESLIVERAQLQLARELGIRADEASIDQGEQNVARQNQVDVAELRRRLARDGMTPAQFRNEIRDQILLTRVRDRELESRVKVSDADVEQYLREHATAPSAAPSELNLAQVLVAVPENATPQQVAERQARAQDVLRRARAGEDFAALARAYSDAPEASAGGALGLRTADRYPDLFLEATAAVPTGGISEPVRSGAGFHVLKVIEKRQAGPAQTIAQQHARHILLRVGPQLTEAAARERLATMKRRIEAGQADFAALARASSQDGSAAEGGDLGWSSPGQFVPEFEDVLDSLQPGQLSDPLVSRFGVHLIQLIERRQYKLSPREQREMARSMVRESRMDEAYRSWLQEVRARAYVEMRDAPQ
ncbi:peptidylprolyl isomerase [Pseudorhodoferax sp. Leaf267]|uniref:peptidylprolyl isomerase n=1 Tax=Pseudorhodoferax sp. Leaf267 TaxID=1736316 RepID=UPI0006F8977D|nr:peptidylprolyl isomerase [Pseudorhodoferax sp. Leaf267]KQP21562.1 molecular chaperone SurA [Pseudorhodoferax sp. Leaf267]